MNGFKGSPGEDERENEGVETHSEVGRWQEREGGLETDMAHRSCIKLAEDDKKEVEGGDYCRS